MLIRFCPHLEPDKIKTYLDELNFMLQNLATIDAQAIKKMIEDLTKVLRRNSESSELVHCYHLRAGCHQELRNWEEAIRDYTEVIRRDPTYYRAYIGRGGAYVFLNDRESAASDLETAARLSQAQGDTEGYQNAMNMINLLGIRQRSSDSSISHDDRQKPGNNKFIPIVAAILFPPLAVYWTVGLGTQFWINLVLTFVFPWIPGMIHAVWLIYNHDQS